MMRKTYRVSKGDGTLEFAWQLTCNNIHVQWFSDEIIARQTCDRLNADELLKENKNRLNAEELLLSEVK